MDVNQTELALPFPPGLLPEVEDCAGEQSSQRRASPLSQTKVVGSFLPANRVVPRR